LRRSSCRALASVGLAVLASGTVHAQVQLQRFAPVQAGPVQAAPAGSAYQPGRVLVQLTEEAFAQSRLDSRWRGGAPATDAASGVAGLDRELALAGVTGFARAFIVVSGAVRGTCHMVKKVMHITESGISHGSPPEGV